MSTVAESHAVFLDEVRRIAREVCGPTADDVDRQARFPSEAIDALQEAGALSALVPAEFGGQGIAFEAVASACFELGATARRPG